MTDATSETQPALSHTNEPLSIKREWMLLLILAAVNFIHICDFVIIMPLGPQFMRVFDISPAQFGILVSSYQFSASIFGVAAAFFIDKFDRKYFLLTLFAGFGVGTLLCALAPSYSVLLCARILTGAFGGILGATIFAFIGDLIPESRRGAATGTVMAAFSVASIAGVPIGLFLATRFSWHTPFMALAALTGVVLIAAFKALPNVRGHLYATHHKNPWGEMMEVLAQRNHQRAFLLMVMIMLAGFTVIAYLSPYMVSNVKLSEAQLPYIYLCGGLVTIFSSRIIGKMADTFGKLRVFTIMALLSIVPILLVTHMGPQPLPWVLTTTTLFMVLVSGRIVPAIAMITSSAKPQHRGSFMSLNSSVQNMAAGLASLLAGVIMAEAQDGRLENYNLVGWIAAVATVLSVFVARFVKPADA